MPERESTHKFPATGSSPRSPFFPWLGNQTRTSVGEARERTLPSHLEWSGRSPLTHTVWEPQPSLLEWQQSSLCTFNPGWASRLCHPHPGSVAFQIPNPRGWLRGLPRPRLPRPPTPPPRRSPRPPWAGASTSTGAAPSPLPHPGRGRTSSGDVKGRAVAAPPRALVKKKKKRGNET